VSLQAGGSRAHSSDDDSDQDYNPDRVDSDHDTDNHGYPSDDYNDHFDSEVHTRGEGFLLSEEIPAF
jgi:hypothetical protein